MIKLDLSKVKFSRRDKEKGIKIPNYLTPELAEDIGMHIGDGAIHFRKNRPSSTAISHSSNVDELDYLKYVIKLKRELYNIKNYKIRKRNNERDLIFHSQAIITFYNSVFNIPIGKKGEIDIPDIIKTSDDKEIIKSVLRGLIDTDFGLIRKFKYQKIYPVLEGASISKRLIKSIAFLFDKLNIKYYIEYDVKKFDKRNPDKIYKINKIILNGFDRINTLFSMIKPKNSKYIKKMNKMGPGRFELPTLKQA